MMFSLHVFCVFLTFKAPAFLLIAVVRLHL
jgi:hypothetical protein